MRLCYNSSAMTCIVILDTSNGFIGFHMKVHSGVNNKGE